MKKKYRVLPIALLIIVLVQACQAIIETQE